MLFGGTAVGAMVGELLSASEKITAIRAAPYKLHIFGPAGDDLTGLYLGDIHSKVWARDDADHAPLVVDDHDGAASHEAARASSRAVGA